MLLFRRPARQPAPRRVVRSCMTLAADAGLPPADAHSASASSASSASSPASSASTRSVMGATVEVAEGLGGAGGLGVSFQTGAVAQLTSGAVIARHGAMTVMTTAVAQRWNHGPEKGFLPLTVDFQERLSSDGRIPSSFMRREFFNGESEISVARIIDRSVRPLFAKGFLNETQIVASLLSYEGGGDERVRRRRCLTWCGVLRMVCTRVRAYVCLSVECVWVALTFGASI